MERADREALFMIRERNGRKEIERVLDRLRQIETEAEENGADVEVALMNYLRA